MCGFSPLFFLSNSALALVALVELECEGFGTFGVLALHPCIVLSSPFQLVRVKDREIVTLGEVTS
jgi:hypothetical protein